MSTTAEYNGEYMLESDEGSPLPALDHFNDTLATYDTLHYLDGFHGTQPKDLYPPPVAPHLAVPKAAGSPPSSDSLSDSSSSKRTGSTLSTKTTLTGGGDVIMSDGYDMKEPQSWKMEDFVNDDEETGEDTGLGGSDGTINPLALETFQFGLDQSTRFRDPSSASNSPSPFDTSASRLTPETSLSPRGNGTNGLSPHVARHYRGHSKGQSHSLTNSMHGLTTNGSREATPWKDPLAWNAKREITSPSALFNSPSPPAGINFDGVSSPSQTAAQVWHSNGNNVFPMPQQMAGGPMVFSQMPMQMHGLSPFNFQPAVYGQGPYNLRIGGVNSKSRVETQIRVNIILSQLPPGVRRLHLPTHTISKPKLWAKPPAQRSPDMLELHTALFCTSALQKPEMKTRALERTRAAAMSMKLEPLPEPAEGEENINQGQNGAEVHICNGCMVRERKRADRKKLKKPGDDKLWLQDEGRRIVVFNSKEIRDWSGPSDEVDGFSVDCQMRIACYCRHHAEKVGFTVIFTITDFQGHFVAQAVSSSIMITDDHKTHGPNSTAANSPPDNSHLLQPPGLAQDANSHNTPGVPIRLAPNPNPASEVQSLNNNPPFTYPVQGAPQSSTVVQAPNPNTRLLSRPASPTSLSGPSSKKRKASGPVKVPSGLSMTRIDTAHAASTPPHPQASAQAPVTSATSPSPFSPMGPMPAFQATSEALFGANGLGSGSMSQPFATGPTTPNGNEVLFANGNRAPSYDNAAMANAHMYSAPASGHPSRAPSPGGFRNNSVNAGQQQNGQFAQALVNGLYNTMPMALSAPPQPRSIIHKIIPAEGPKSGGIEVTILGSGFQQGLEVMFGDVRATTTTFWGETSLVCLLPPCDVAGTVLVTLKHLNPAAAPQMSAKGQPTFKYTDDDEQQLMRTALTVLGHKMNGKVEDIGDIARRIIGNMDSSWNPSSSGPSGQRGGGGGQFNNYSVDSDVEGQLLKVLELIDLDDSPHKPRLNLRRSTGQTMLHLACSLGMQRFVAGLLARGANPDLHDKGGYTALHMASLNDHPEIVRRLITCGADPTLRTLSGLTAADVARSREVVRAIRRVERDVRSQSVGSLKSHSRASSATSLRSLWDPQMAMTQISPEHEGQESDADSESGEESPEYSGEESPEYSSENLASEEDAEDADENDGPYFPSRRSSMNKAQSRRNSLDGRVKPRRAGVAGLHSPAAAVTALKDQMTTQIHNFHQAMALHLQNMPQIPYLPQMPAMSPLADYQAYTNSQAFVQRLASMVPNMRPGSDSKWPDMSLAAAPAAPPAYEEIFPRDDLDTKQASAAQAAAEAEADQKCAALYDQPGASTAEDESDSHTTEASSSDTEVPEQSQQYKLPPMLQIGRKNAVTKEQQENLQRARAVQLKTLSSDRPLFFIWIPLLVILICTVVYNHFPTLFSTVRDFFLGDITGNTLVSLAGANVARDEINAVRIPQIVR